MLIDDPAAVLPADRLIRDPDVLAGFAHDEAEWAPYAQPAVVVRPRGAEEVHLAPLVISESAWSYQPSESS